MCPSIVLQAGGRREGKCELTVYGNLNRLINIYCMDIKNDIKYSFNPNKLNVSSAGVKYISYKMKAGKVEAGSYTLRLVAQSKDERYEQDWGVSILPADSSLIIDCKKKLWVVPKCGGKDKGECTIVPHNFCSYVNFICGFYPCRLECSSSILLVCNKPVKPIVEIYYYPRHCFSEAGIYPLYITVSGYQEAISATFKGKLILRK